MNGQTNGAESDEHNTRMSDALYCKGVYEIAEAVAAEPDSGRSGARERTNTRTDERTTAQTAGSKRVRRNQK